MQVFVSGPRVKSDRCESYSVLPKSQWNQKLVDRGGRKRALWRYATYRVVTYGRTIAIDGAGAAGFGEFGRTAATRIFDFERCRADERWARRAEHGDALWCFTAAAEAGLD